MFVGQIIVWSKFNSDEVLKHWECNVNFENEEVEDSAFVVTRRQAVLKAAQDRLDKRIDREKEVAMLKQLSKPSKHDGKEPLESSDFLPDLSKRNDQVVESDGVNEPSQLESDSSLLELNNSDQPGESLSENSNANEPETAIEYTKANQVREFENLSNANSGCRDADQDEPRNLLNVLLRDKDQFVSDQQKDASIRSLVISDEPPKDSDGYFRRNGVVMHRKHLRSKGEFSTHIDRVVVPQFLRQEILRISHSIPIAGHMGIEKTRARLENHFYWPGFYSDIRNYCLTCPECQMIARKRVHERAPLNPVPIVAEPFEKVAIDIVGELPKSKSGFKYILTLVDYATRYPEAVPLKTAYSREIANALIHIFCNVGIPKELVSDQGANFLSTLMTQL